MWVLCLMWECLIFVFENCQAIRCHTGHPNERTPNKKNKKINAQILNEIHWRFARIAFQRPQTTIRLIGLECVKHIYRRASSLKTSFYCSLKQFISVYWSAITSQYLYFIYIAYYNIYSLNKKQWRAMMLYIFCQNHFWLNDSKSACRNTTYSPRLYRWNCILKAFQQLQITSICFAQCVHQNREWAAIFYPFRNLVSIFQNGTLQATRAFCSPSAILFWFAWNVWYGNLQKKKWNFEFSAKKWRFRFSAPKSGAFDFLRQKWPFERYFNEIFAFQFFPLNNFSKDPFFSIE